MTLRIGTSKNMMACFPAEVRPACMCMQWYYVPRTSALIKPDIYLLYIWFKAAVLGV